MSNISTRAMLVSLSIEQWGARKHDSVATNEVAQAHGVREGSGRYNKLLVSKARLEPVAKVASAARDRHYALTLPWSDAGARILGASGYLPYMGEMQAFGVDFERAADAFAAGYSDAIYEARASLGSLFDHRDYPPLGKVRSAFAMGVHVAPLPDGKDFRVDLDAIQVEAIRADIEARSRDAVAAAVSDTWDRVAAVVGKMAERLKAYAVDPATGKASGIFRDSLVGNVAELADILPRLNVTGDARLDAVARDLKARLCSAEPAELRASDALRASVAAAADDILRQMAEYTGTVGDTLALEVAA